MPCFHPLDAFQPEGGGKIIFTERAGARAITIPCGQCIGCRRRRQQEWAARIVHESQCHRFSWFVTFTYDDEHLPAGGLLRYADFQQFLKNARKKFGPFRFFVAGEYGAELRRPHFHACLFGLCLRDLVNPRKSPSGHTLWSSPSLQNSWRRGFVSVGLLSFESAQYTASYVTKGVSDWKADPATGEVRREFARMSRNPGIGNEWFKRFGASDALPRDFVRVNGRKLPVPRYYTNLFKLSEPFGYEALAFERVERSDLSASDRTPARLAEREVCETARLSRKIRKL